MPRMTAIRSSRASMRDRPARWSSPDEEGEADEDADDTGGTYRGKAGHTTNQIFVVCPWRGRARSFCVAVLLLERVEEEQQQRFGFPSIGVESSRPLPAANSLPE